MAGRGADILLGAAQMSWLKDILRNQGIEPAEGYSGASCAQRSKEICATPGIEAVTATRRFVRYWYRAS